jgi:hypothetical protein
MIYLHYTKGLPNRGLTRLGVPTYLHELLITYPLGRAYLPIYLSTYQWIIYLFIYWSPTYLWVTYLHVGYLPRLGLIKSPKQELCRVILKAT